MGKGLVQGLGCSLGFCGGVRKLTDNGDLWNSPQLDKDKMNVTNVSRGKGWR